MNGIRRTANRLLSENAYNENSGVNDVKRDTKVLRSRQVLGIKSSSTTQACGQDGSKIPQIVVPSIRSQPKSRFMDHNELVGIANNVLQRLFERSKSKKPLLLTAEEYVDSFHYTRLLEETRSLPSNFMEGSVVNNKVRQILVDWMMLITNRFTMEHETCHLAIAILDRCIGRIRPLEKNQLQLLAATCVYIAAKNEEVIMHHAQDFTYMADDCFSIKDLLKMETKVFAAINFNANFPTAVGFLRRFRFFTEPIGDNYILSKLIVDLGYLDSQLCLKLPSVMALCAHYIANYLIGAPFDPVLLKMNGLTETEFMREVVDYVEPVMSYISKNRDCAVRKKYSFKFTETHKTKLLSLKSKYH